MARNPDVTIEQVRRFRIARTRALEAIDIPDPPMFVGECACESALYARTGDREVRCRTCGEVYETKAPDVWSLLGTVAGPLERVWEWLLVLGVQRSRAPMYRDARSVAGRG
jgi:hypothetical protein